MGTSFPPHYNPGHVTSTICRDNWLGFKSLWLRLMIRAYGQGVRLTFKLRCSVLRVRVKGCSSPNANKKLLTVYQS